MHALGFAIQFLTVAVMLGLGFMWVVGMVRKNPLWWRLSPLIALVWVVSYLTLLLGVSLASKPSLLALGEKKQFCGFYLDCHSKAYVSDVARTPQLGTLESGLTAQGEFYVISLRTVNDAVRVPGRLKDPWVVLTDQSGRRYQRVPAAEDWLAERDHRNLPLEYLTSANSDSLTILVFDVAQDAEGLRLLLRQGDWLTQLTELFLIGDEDSLFHERTYFDVTPTSKPG